MDNFEKKECNVVRSEWINGDYQVKQGVKGSRYFKGWKNGSWIEIANGVMKIITPAVHRLICKDEKGNLHNVNVTQAAHRNGYKRWDKQKASNFVENSLMKGIYLLCSENSPYALISDDSFVENSQKLPEFGISDLDSKNPYFDDDLYCEFK